MKFRSLFLTLCLMTPSLHASSESDDDGKEGNRNDTMVAVPGHYDQHLSAIDYDHDDDGGPAREEAPHDQSLLEKCWDYYYSINPIAQKPDSTTRGVAGYTKHYGYQLIALVKRKAQKLGYNQDEIATLKLGIALTWANSTLHEQDRTRYLQEALLSTGQIKQEFATRETIPLSKYVQERIADLGYLLSLVLDKSKPLPFRKLILDAIEKTHSPSKLLEFPIPPQNATGKELITVCRRNLATEIEKVGAEKDNLDVAAEDGAERKQ